MKITQIAHELITDFDELPTQHSANIEINFERDKSYSEYIISAFYGLIANGNCEQFAPLPVDNEKITLPQKAFSKNGYIAIGFVFYKDGVVERTNQRTFRIRANIGNNDILPEDDKVWQDVVISVMNQYIDLKITPQIQKLIDEAIALQKNNEEQQEIIQGKIEEFDILAENLRSQINELIGAHIDDKNNPHEVTLEQVDPDARTVKYEDSIIIDYNGTDNNSTKSLNVRGIKHKTNTSDGWKTENPILLNGEIGIDTDLKRNKIGNGTSTWEALEWFGGSVEIFATTDEFPEIGQDNTIYITTTPDREAYIWLVGTREYKNLTSSGGLKFERSDIIIGGADIDIDPLIKGYVDKNIKVLVGKIVELQTVVNSLIDIIYIDEASEFPTKIEVTND